MELLELVVALFYAPVFAAVLAGILSRRTTERGAFAGICAGIVSSLALQGAFSRGLVPFGSQMNADFYEAILSFSVAIAACMILRPGPREGVAGNGTIHFDVALRRSLRPSRGLVLLSAALLAVCLLLNLVWW